MAITVINVVRYVLKRTILAVLLACLAGLRAAIPGQSPLQVMFSAEQLQKETVIWQITQTPSGQIVAAGEKIGFYGNNRWQFLDMPPKRAIRSLLVDGQTLWIASNGEVGRIELPLTTHSEYQVLSVPELKSAGEFWHLAKSGEFLVAVTKENVWFIDPIEHKVRQVLLPNKYRLSLVTHDGRLLVSQSGVGLWEIKNAELLPFENPLTDRIENAYLWGQGPYLLTVQNLYRKEGTHYRPLLDFRSLNRAVAASESLWGDHLAVALYNKGLALVEIETGKVEMVTQSSSAASLGAASTFADADDRLWVGYTQGIAVFEALRYGHQIKANRPLSALRANGLLINYDDHSDYYRDGQSAQKLERIFSFKMSREGQLALGLWGEIQIGPKKFPIPGNKVGIIVEVENGNFVAVSGERLYFVNTQTGQSEQLNELKSEVSGMILMNKTLWVTTADRVLYRSPSTPPFDFTRVSEIPDGPAADIMGLNGSLVFISGGRVRYGLNFENVENTGGLRNPRLATTDGTLWLTGEQDGAQRVGRLLEANGKVTWEICDAKSLPSLPEVRSFTANEGFLTFCSDTTILELNIAELKPHYRLGAIPLSFTVHHGKPGENSITSVPPAELRATENRLTFSGFPAFDEFGEKPGFERRLLPTETAWIAT